MTCPWQDWLVANGIITQAQAVHVQPPAADPGVGADRALVMLGYCTSEDILNAKSEVYGVRRVNLDEVDIPEAVIELIPESAARELSVLPIEEGDDGLVIAMSDPGDVETIERLRFILNRAIVVKLASPDEVSSAINHTIHSQGRSRWCCWIGIELSDYPMTFF